MRVSRLAAAVAVAALVSVSCGWAYPGFDAANTRNNPTEFTLTPANVSGITEQWRTTSLVTGGDLLQVKGRVYLERPFNIGAYDPAGVQGCAGSPKSCDPLLTFDTTYCATCRSFAVADDTLFTWRGADDLLAAGALVAFDATGSRGCDAVTHSCRPIRTYETGRQPSFVSRPVVVGGVLYVVNHSRGAVEAFDAAGVRSCSAAVLAVCTPLWTSALPAPVYTSESPVIANGVAYVMTQVGLAAFDAHGKISCSGSPAVCSPLWVAVGVPTFRYSPAVANGYVYVSELGRLQVYDANGVTNCTGSPRICSPVWSSPSGGPEGSGSGGPVVTSEYVLVPALGVSVFDAHGMRGCSGTPKVCTPIRSIPTEGPLTVANGLAVASSWKDSTAVRVYDVQAFEPSPLWNLPSDVGPMRSALIANGALLVQLNDGTLRSYGLG